MMENRRPRMSRMVVRKTRRLLLHGVIKGNTQKGGEEEVPCSYPGMAVTLYSPAGR